MKELASESYYLSEEGILEFDFASEYTYDAAGRLILELVNEDGHYWKTEYAYNANGKKISETDYRGEETINGPYRLDMKTEYEYTNSRLTKILEYGCYDDGSVIISTLYGTTIFYYGSGGTGVVSPDADKALRIYAADGYLTFDLPQQSTEATLQVFDLTGRTVLKTQAVSGRPVAIPSLHGGVYIYRILAGVNSYNGKLYIRK